MTGSHIDTVATGGRFDGTLGVLAGLEVLETVITAGIELAHPLAVAFFTDEEGSRFAPDMLGSLVFAGGMPLEDALVDHGDRRAAPRRRAGAHRLRGSAAVPGPAAARVRRAAHRAGSGARSRGRDDRRGHRRAGHLVDRADDHRPVEPRRHHADGDAPRRRLRRGRDRGVRPPARRPRWARRRSRPSGRIELHPNLVNVVAARATLTVDLRNTDDELVLASRAPAARVLRRARRAARA